MPFQAWGQKLWGVAAPDVLSSSRPWVQGFSHPNSQGSAALCSACVCPAQRREEVLRDKLELERGW